MVDMTKKQCICCGAEKPLDSEAVRISRSRTRVTGVPWEIDHIVPIKAKFASGLHNAFNIQVVPKRWNELKSNKNADLFFPRREIGY